MTPRNQTVDTAGQDSVNGSLSDYNEQREVIFRIDPHGKYLRFNGENRVVKHLMVKFSRARTVYRNRPEVFEEFVSPHQTLTITGTEKDAKTMERPRWQVMNFLEELGIAVRYIPDWGWVYGNQMDRADRRNMIDRYLSRLEWLYEKRKQLGLDHIEFIPAAKGFRRRHYEWALSTFQRVGVDRIAIYVGQTRSLPNIIERIEHAIDVFDPEGVVVVGRQAPQDVAQLPERVDGVAGLRNWKKACNLTKEGYSSEKLVTWYDKVKEALRNGRTHRQIGLSSAVPGEVVSDG